VQDDTLLPVSPLRIVEAGDRGQIAADATCGHALGSFGAKLYYGWPREVEGTALQPGGTIPYEITLFNDPATHKTDGV
jgi:hypothetical protein